MKIKYLFGSIGFVILSIISSCTNLDETIYDTVMGATFYQSKDNVYQGFARPYTYAFGACSGSTFCCVETGSDHFMTPNRQGHWLDQQVYFRMHWHEWTIDDSNPRGAWNDNFQTVVSCNSTIADLSRLDPAKVQLTAAEITSMINNLRTLRAFAYLKLFDMFRNIPIVTDFPSEEALPAQVSPQETFNFIESELKEMLNVLEVKSGSGGNGNKQGLWNKAGVAALLVRLYLNAQLWIGQDRLADCANYAQRIIDGEFGSYGIASRWDAPFDWNNETCEELIYAFTSTYSSQRHHYGSNMFWWGAPFKAPPYFGFTQEGDMNPRHSLQPGLDLYGKELPYANGKPVRKFMNYPDDVRLKKYRNLGNSTREGMFLFGTLPYVAANGTLQYVRADNNRYMLYIRDQCGWFEDTDTLSISPAPSSGAPVMISDMDHADQSSGWYMIKYPIYRNEDAGKFEADFAVIRLPEIYYSLAECKFRKGDKAGAAALLNKVRARYYPAGSPSLYKEDGSQITEQELLDEWGREFLGEGIRRTVLCRFGVYCGDWWDKKVEADKHTMLLPLARTILDANPNLVQNPGYPSNK